MMTTLIAWLFKDPARAAGAGVIALLLALAGVQELRLAGKDHSVAVLQKAAAAQDTIIGQLRQDTASQEAALKALAKMGAEAQAAQVAAEARSKAATKATAVALTALRAASVPKACEGAATWGAVQAADLAKGWGK
ncbi:MAG: hypothetical protein M3Y65_24805 [Pseudomonadota bacterium]|nr:hypothetical protein [Pseudomonadota bacterium]